MPWLETNPVMERRHFAHDFESGHWTMTELCLRYGISRTAGYKWIDRFRQEGARGFSDHSRAPRSCPHQTPQEIVELILDENGRFGWGARKILKRLKTRYPGRTLPARSTIFDVLERNGRVQPRRRRKHWKHPGAVPFDTTAPNQIWTADFKGQFLRLFREYGLPDAIRSDNGAPFASTGIHGLSTLNVWWLQLGITHQRITPGSPQENGAHERMHKTLKAKVTKPAAANLNLQQRVFNRFRETYNEIRPHESLNDETPASVWTPSNRPYPARILPPEYPGHVEVRRVSNKGTFRLKCGQIFLSQTLNGEHIGLEEVNDGLWNILYYQTLLGRFDERTKKITGAPSLREKC